MTVIVSPPTGAEQAGALAERVFGAALATFDLACIHIGHRVGLYDALSTSEPRTAAQIAERAGTDERYTREWLEQQAATGIIDCVDANAKPLEFTLPEGHALALRDPKSLASVAGFARATIGALSALNLVVDAFRTGAGVPYAYYGADMREGIADTNLPMYTHLLPDWLRAIPDVHARLREPGAHVADIACGIGHSTRAIAGAYPHARVDGFDEDEASIERARALATERTRFYVQDASDPSLAGSYDLVTIFQAVHDMNHPVEALTTAHGLLAPHGALIVADQKVPHAFSAPSEDPMERLSYGFSVLHCLPVGRIDHDAAATGTVMRPHTLEVYAREAGFAGVEILDIENDFWRFYRLRPRA
ncbi:class I SAM-dependent methyltransferase [Solirubrobacter ginsenosidimutans]|uniref:Class I SAM-dependent methyltransferase n=1 Tax=Solirubrobacter ginsenosidimutans TaxID=490573 RepID=A0A9X3MUC1_9ACTN|nr:class I SAM-dependent methyltransferase [Solirubrobacter ginsenosidimutans]MDA0162071.1 class I SAM-dependent methyltransferase [Solirubrobacter ginsenosidimutans]